MNMDSHSCSALHLRQPAAHHMVTLEQDLVAREAKMASVNLSSLIQPGTHRLTVCGEIFCFSQGNDSLGNVTKSFLVIFNKVQSAQECRYRETAAVTSTSPCW